MYSYSSVLVRLCLFFFFSSRRRHTRFDCDWSSDVCSSDLERAAVRGEPKATLPVEAVKIYAGVGDDLLCRAFRKVYAEGIGKFFDRFIKGSLDGGFDQAPLDLVRSEEHTSELQSQSNLVCRLLLANINNYTSPN